MRDARTHYPRRAKNTATAILKEAQIKEQTKKRAPTESIEFNFSSDDDYSPAITPPPVPDFAHPYFVAIETINSTINDMQSGNGVHELLLKNIAETQRKKLITTKEHTHSEADKIVIQALIDRIDKTLLQPSPLTRNHLWAFTVPTQASLQQIKEKEKTLKRAKTDSTDSLDNKLADPEIELTVQKIRVNKPSLAKPMAALGIHKKREENPNRRDAQSARQYSLGLRKKPRINYKETRTNKPKSKPKP